MKTLPIGVFIGAIGLGVLFEYLYGFIRYRLRLAPEKDISVFLYWVMLWVLGMLCEIIPPFKDHKEWMNWLPMLCVGAIHVVSVFMGFSDTWTFFDDDYDDDAAPGSGGGPKYPRKKRLPR